MNNVAIVLGAGSGSRMKIEKSKLLLEIGGKTVIERSVEAFLDISDIDEIIVTVREQDIEEFSSLIKDERVSFVIGGDTRQKSVKNAVETIDECDLIIIHDGARPLIKAEDIEKTIREAKDYGAAAVGVKVKDTIKVIDCEGFVIDTPDRSTLFSVQTPQVFNFALYKQALLKAEKENMDFTDDCQLIEFIGQKVKMVEGSYSNIKITTQEDIPLAENILKS
ncbi:MAG: 2-C-methyl-D-erythritol 4-phosphate cytidylyltransferase [Ruminococcaceae bacterium]|nr:2-C-methyl-D-erythritol 4-phosphate cytidylyltransferase [Oscillospiraceae bacterium]